ncbi:MAG: nitroreductase/quinone reductase family protein [Pseudomonadota bacterium]
MKALKWLGGTIAVYVVFVVVFEAGYLGLMQPSFEDGGIPMLVLTTTDDSGQAATHMLARFETEDKLYVSAHHWTRGWYHRAVANPQVKVEINGFQTQRRAITVVGEEFDNVAAAYQIPFAARFLMGFPPPRDILRLDLVQP